MPDILRPAIVKPATPIDAIHKATMLAADIKARSRTNLADAIALGKLLIGLKDGPMGGHGLWGETLETIGIVRQRASEFMQLAKCPAPDISECESIRDAMLIVNAAKQPETPPPEAIPAEQGDACEGPMGGGETQAAEPGPPPDDPAPKVHYCRQCRMLVTKPAKCKQCNSERKELAKAAETEEPDDESPPEKPPEVPTDQEGHVLPSNLIDVFTAIAKFKELDSHCRAIQSGLDEVAKLPGGEQIKHRLRAHGNDEKIAYKSDHLNELKRDVKFTRPHSVCPWCKGKPAKCDKCQQTGWVSKMTWDACEDDTKARLT